MNNNYEIKKLSFDDKDIERIVKLQNIVYADRHLNFTISGMNFWYLENPLGDVISFNAFCGDDVVAHYACIPIRMKIDGQLRDGLLDIATVTHPEHRGKGLFKNLAQKTFEYAKNVGYEFVIGVANANSFPGYMKYFDFTFIAPLDVKIGIGKISSTGDTKQFSCFWTLDTLKWRVSKSCYGLKGNCIYSTYKKMPFIRLFMGQFSENLSSRLNLNKRGFAPFNMYIGLGADLSKGHYFNLPKFIKHSPFNLIFLDLTGGKLPKPTKDNIFFQLIDFDVA